MGLQRHTFTKAKSPGFRIGNPGTSAFYAREGPQLYKAGIPLYRGERRDVQQVVYGGVVVDKVNGFS